jgi:hypothetical protein
MDLGPSPTFFEQILGGVAGAQSVWLEKIWNGVGFLIWSYVELCQTDTNVIYHSCQLDASIQA